MSVYDYIESRIPSGHPSPLGRLLDVAYVIEYGAGAAKTGQRLAKIKKPPPVATVCPFARGSGTSEVVANYVILAIPFAVLDEVDMSGFDTLKLRVITEQGCGHNGKLHLQFGQHDWLSNRPARLGSPTARCSTPSKFLLKPTCAKE